jgi:hypothetical protein
MNFKVGVLYRGDWDCRDNSNVNDLELAPILPSLGRNHVILPHARTDWSCLSRHGWG